MALIVLDSLADRLLYEHAEAYFGAAESMSWQRDRQYPREKRSQILRDFGSKVSLALIDRDPFPYPNALLDSLDAEIFRVAHRYRNAGHHGGKHNDALTGPLGCIYAAAISRAFSRSAESYSRGGMDDSLLTELDRFNWRDPRTDSGFFSPGPASERITAEIILPIAVEVQDLARSLEADLERRSAGVGKLLDGLRGRGLPDELIASFLTGAQHWAAHRADSRLIQLTEAKHRLISEVGGRENPPDTLIDAYRQNETAIDCRTVELTATTNVRFDLHSAERVRRLASRLGSERSPATLLQRYQHLDQELEQLENAVDWVVTEWDRHVEHQIEIARGK